MVEYCTILFICFLLSSFQGCVEKVVDGFKHNLGAIAGGAIVLGLVQVKE